MIILILLSVVYVVITTFLWLNSQTKTQSKIYRRARTKSIFVIVTLLVLLLVTISLVVRIFLKDDLNVELGASLQSDTILG